MNCTLENVIRRDRRQARDETRERKMMELFRTFIAEHIPEFDPSLIDASEYDKILRWIAQYRMHQIHLQKEAEGIESPECAPPEKGLLFVGKTGRGKTTCARLIGGLFGFPFASMDQIDVAWSRNPDECERDFFDFFSSSKPVVLDDVGAESGQKRYGNESIVTSFLHRLYDNWRFCGKQIIMTSNLSTWDGAPDNQATFLGKYGERIHSRMLEMFEVVKINGSVDLRKEYHK